MRRSLLVVVLLVGCDSEDDRRARCTRFVEGRDVGPAWIEQCVKERWSPAQMECHLRAGGGLQGMFCDD